MKINTKEFKSLLESLKSGLSGNKETTEQSNCFAFTEDRIYTYNDEISVSIPNPIEFEGAIYSQELLALLNKIDTAEIEIEYNDKELNIKSGRTKAGIVLQKEIEMPIQEINIPEKWLKLPSDFIEALKTCIFSTSSDESIILNNIDCSKNILQSSDNERATRFTISSKLRKSFLIPAGSARELCRILDISSYTVDEDWIHFKTSTELIFSCRTSNEEYPPDIENYFESNGFEFSFPEGTKDILERANIFAESDFIQDKLVKINISSKGIFKISAEGDTGWIEETKRVKTKPKTDIQFSINPQYLQQILNKTNKAIIGDELVWFNIDNFEHVVSLEE